MTPSLGLLARACSVLGFVVGCGLVAGHCRADESAGRETAQGQQLSDWNAPLTPKITVKRRGRVLQLDCEIQGAATGFAQPDRNHPPRFVVYKAGQEIGGGTFEYG